MIVLFEIIIGCWEKLFASYQLLKYMAKENIWEGTDRQTAFICSVMKVVNIAVFFVVKFEIAWMRKANKK